MTSKMTAKEWKALLPEDVEVLKTLGILDLVKPIEQAQKRSSAPALESYVLKRTGTCNTCRSTFIKYFRMIPSLTKRFLSSTAIRKEDILLGDIIKEEKDFYSGCPLCYTVLSKNSKEELIKKLIQASNRKE